MLNRMPPQNPPCSDIHNRELRATDEDNGPFVNPYLRNGEDGSAGSVGSDPLDGIGITRGDP